MSASGRAESLIRAAHHASQESHNLFCSIFGLEQIHWTGASKGGLWSAKPALKPHVEVKFFSAAVNRKRSRKLISHFGQRGR